MATTTTVTLSVFSVTAGDMGSLQTHSEATATTTSAASGAVDFRANYRLALLQPSWARFLPVGYGFNSGWQYTFTPTTNAQLTVDYDVDAGVLFGPSFGGWNIRLDQGLNIGSTSFVNGTGSSTADLVAGASYKLVLFSDEVRHRRARRRRGDGELQLEHRRAGRHRAGARAVDVAADGRGPRRLRRAQAASRGRPRSRMRAAPRGHVSCGGASVFPQRPVPRSSTHRWTARAQPPPSQWSARCRPAPRRCHWVRGSRR